jgi:hypothetical protein
VNGKCGMGNGECGMTPATSWTAVAERSGDTALASREAELRFSHDRSAGRESVVALRFPPQSKTPLTFPAALPFRTPHSPFLIPHFTHAS